MPSLDLGDERLDGSRGGRKRVRERRGVVAERPLERGGRRPDLVEVSRRRNDGRRADRALEDERSLLGLLDPGRLLDETDRRELLPELLELAAPRELAGKLGEDDDRGDLTSPFTLLDRPELRVEHEPGSLLLTAERNQVGAPAGCRLGGEHRAHLAVGARRRRGALELVNEGHRGHRTLAAVDRSDHARELFAPLGPSYERYASALSYGQDPRWRRFLVSRIDAGPGDRVLDVATGTGAVARELVNQKACAVVGVDQSREMLAEARRRTDGRIELIEASAEELPFADGEFDGLTFTYLMRYVDEPVATLRELARVVKPGGTIAGLEFGLPGGLWRVPWEAHVRTVLPGVGLAYRHGWREAGSFLGPSIRSHYRRWPLEAQLEAWRETGLTEVASLPMSFGAGIVIWGRKR